MLRRARSESLDPAPAWVDAWLAEELELLMAAAWASARPADGAWLAEPLTAKKHEVLGHLAELLTTEEIAGAVYVSVNTVRTHVRHILQKPGATRRSEAVRLASASGLLDRRSDSA